MEPEQIRGRFLRVIRNEKLHGLTSRDEGIEIWSCGQCTKVTRKLDEGNISLGTRSYCVDFSQRVMLQKSAATRACFIFRTPLRK